MVKAPSDFKVVKNLLVPLLKDMHADKVHYVRRLEMWNKEYGKIV